MTRTSNEANQALNEANQISNEAFQASNEANQALNEANQASNGANQALNGANQALNGANQALNGANQALNGANQALNGANQASNGANQASNGANQALNEANQASNGANQISSEAFQTIRTVFLRKTGTYLVFIAIFALFVTQCAYGNFQTAKTVPKKSYRITMAQQFQGNKDLKKRSVSAVNFPPELMVRVGIADRVDLGFSLFMMGGLLVDAKINLFPGMDRFALALGGGIGAAADWGNMDIEELSTVLHVPLKAIVSYRIGEGFSPYFCLGYSFFWIFGRDSSDIPPPEDPNTTYAERKGYGDGVLRFTVGFEYMLNVRFGVLMEYSFWLPVVDDSGDFYTFIPNHMGGFGFVF